VISRQAAVWPRAARCGNVVADLLAEQVPSQRLSLCARDVAVGHQLGPAITAQTNVVVQG
jgi:hypothetical protein